MPRLRCESCGFLGLSGTSTTSSFSPRMSSFERGCPRPSALASAAAGRLEESRVTLRVETARPRMTALGSRGLFCERLTVGEVNSLGHGRALEHVLDFPAFRDVLWRELDAGALRGVRELRREVGRLDREIDCRSAAHEDLRDDVGRGEWQEDCGTVDRFVTRTLFGMSGWMVSVLASTS